MSCKKTCEFEEKIKKSLEKLNVPLNEQTKIGLAVSGGADSVSLLLSLCNILSPLSIPLYVITINHNIREENETLQDALFVEKLCKNLCENGFLVDFTCKTFERNEVFFFAKKRGGGVEDAARYLRYKAFDNFITEKKLDFLCLAHNKNDNSETILMRFLQGGNLESLCGIRSLREKYLRPMLDISRMEIEEYLKEKNQLWCTDSTNDNLSYLRNRIRHKLIPFLNDFFPFWEEGILRGQKKYSEDLQVILSLVKNESSKSLLCQSGGKYISSEGSEFVKAEEQILKFEKIPQTALLKRLILKKFNEIGIFCRVPDVLLDEICNAIANPSQVFNKNFEGYDIIVKKSELLIKKELKKHTDCVFFDIIEKDGLYNFPFGSLLLTDGKLYLNGCLSDVSLKTPFCIRNVSFGDFIKTSDGKKKRVRDIFSDWHIPLDVREKIPLIENVFSGEIECLLSAFLGYKDWVVKQNEKSF